MGTRARIAQRSRTRRFRRSHRTFLEEVDDTIGRLGQTEAEPSLEEQLHFLKGSALNIGFGVFADLCQNGETAAAKGRAGDIDLDAIRIAYAEARQEFLDKTHRVKAA